MTPGSSIGSTTMRPEDLARLVDDARVEELPEVAAALELARVKLQLRLVAPAPAPTRDAVRFLTPDQAAEIAGIPTKRLYEWARKKAWAHRPNTRTLRIDEQAFRRWLESR